MANDRAALLKGTVERRIVAITDEFEVRAVGNDLKFSGYASLFDVRYDMWGGPERGGYTEHVNRQAFKRTLASKPDVVLNINHGEGGTGLPIARTTSGTLDLRTDSKGLLPSASLDLRDPDVQALQVKIERGDVNQMSFAFRTISDLWTDEESDRELMELSLDRGDVSIVTNGAQSKTSVQLRTLEDALAMLANADPGQLVEARSLDSIVAAQHILTEALTTRDTSEVIAEAIEDLNEPVSLTTTRRLSVAVAERLLLLDA